MSAHVTGMHANLDFRAGRRALALAMLIGLGLGLNLLPASAATPAAPAALATDSQPGNAELIQRGQYLATAGDCIACHSVGGGAPMAGGLALATPLGAIVSSNITPSRTHGIGNYTLQQFSDALRKGVRADGQHLYPAMPYTAYSKVSDADTAALYTYFMHGVKAVDSAPAQQTALPFPFNVRLSMAAWNALFLDTTPYAADPRQSVEWNRGAYLATGLAHCSTCHTARNALMAEELSKPLGGASLGNWYAPNITADANAGLGGWSVAELAEYLRSGRAAGKAQAAGPMAEAIDHSLRHLDAADLHAIATYIKQVPALHDGADAAPVTARGAASNGMAYLRGEALPSDPERMSGAQLFDAHCASCHQAKGQGSFDGSLPALFHNTALGRGNTDNLVMVLLEGIQRQATGDGGASLETRMPAFRTTLSDQQIVTLGNYLTTTYGNPAAKVTAPQVQELRSGGAGSMLVLLARLGMAAGLVIVLGLLVWWLKRRGKA